jgi:hypothetical protein
MPKLMLSDAEVRVLEAVEAGHVVGDELWLFRPTAQSSAIKTCPPSITFLPGASSASYRSSKRRRKAGA